MSKATTKVQTLDEIDYIFFNDGSGKLICAPVDLEKFERYIADIKALGPDAIKAKLAEIRGESGEGTAWRDAAEKRLDALRRERAAEIDAELSAKPLGCY